MASNITLTPFTCIPRRHGHSMGIFHGENPLDYPITLFYFEIVLVVSLYRVLRLLLKPFKQPRVVSMIVAGFILGPSALSRSEVFINRIFPNYSQFLIANIGPFSFMYFFFVLGVKMDLFSIAKAGRKHVYLILVGIFVPFFAGLIVGLITRSSTEYEGLREASVFGTLVAIMAIPSYPAIYLILEELNLLSSEVGRLAISTSLTSGLLGIATDIIYEGIEQAEKSRRNVLLYMTSVVVMITFLILVVRPVLFWVIKKTPEGKPVNQTCLVFLMVGALMMGFFSDMFGIGMVTGPFWLGLVVPDGPPLGATVVERTETIVMEIMMPLAFALTGMSTNFSAMVDYGWSRLAPLIATIIVVYVIKFLSTMAVALYFKIPFKDSIVLGLVVSLRGEVETTIYMYLLEKQVLTIPTFTMMMLSTVVVTGICTPLINIIYDPTKPYMVNKRRTIQHTPPGSELRMVVCVQDNKDVYSIVNFLEISYPTLNSPFSVSMIHLVELIARVNPVFIEHDKIKGQLSEYQNLYHALECYQASRDEFVRLQLFTTITPKRTMYQDICKLALMKKAVIIILPFNREAFDSVPGSEIIRQGIGAQSIYCNVLAHAPCSVGLLVDKSDAISNPVMPHSFRQSLRKFVMLFLGGADSREALTYADRVAMNPEVCLIVIRFLSYNNGENEFEKKLDDGVVTWFRVKNERNERVVYRDLVVKNGEDTLAALHELNDNTNELWIVGREERVNPVIIEGLSNWSQNPELGVIGDVIASADFGSRASVLVVQQQVLRAQGKAYSGAPRGSFLSSLNYKGW